MLFVVNTMIGHIHCLLPDIKLPIHTAFYQTLGGRDPCVSQSPSSLRCCMDFLVCEPAQPRKRDSYRSWALRRPVESPRVHVCSRSQLRALRLELSSLDSRKKKECRPWTPATSPPRSSPKIQIVLSVCRDPYLGTSEIVFNPSSTDSSLPPMGAVEPCPSGPRI
jgi:hypothetical protein